MLVWFVWIVCAKIDIGRSLFKQAVVRGVDDRGPKPTLTKRLWSILAHFRETNTYMLTPWSKSLNTALRNNAKQP